MHASVYVYRNVRKAGFSGSSNCATVRLGKLKQTANLAHYTFTIYTCKRCSTRSLCSCSLGEFGCVQLLSRLAAHPGTSSMLRPNSISQSFAPKLQWGGPAPRLATLAPQAYVAHSFPSKGRGQWCS